MRNIWSDSNRLIRLMSWCPALLFDGDRSLPAICSIDYRLRVKEEGSAEISRWRDCAEFPLASPSPPFAVRSVTGADCDPAYGRTRSMTASYLPKILHNLTRSYSLGHRTGNTLKR